jgi:hypothetical protein
MEYPMGSPVVLKINPVGHGYRESTRVPLETTLAFLRTCETWEQFKLAMFMYRAEGERAPRSDIGGTHKKKGAAA